MNKKEKLVFDLLKKHAFKVIASPSGKVKYSFVEPGIAYHNTLWDWDSYWSIFALNDTLEILKNDKDFDYQYYRKLVNEGAKGDVLNFYDYMEEVDYYNDVYDDFRMPVQNQL